MQNDSRGLNALGAAGGLRIRLRRQQHRHRADAAVQFNLYAGAAGGPGIAFTSGGTIATEAGTSPVNLASGDPIQVTLAYDGSNLVETLRDLTTSSTYSQTFRGVNLAAFTGGNSAYVGFSGGTGL